MTVRELEARLGAPASIDRPSADDPSPWGQWLVWKRPDSTVFRALADDYSPVSTDSSASLRYIELSAPPEAEQEAFVRTVYGFQLMDTDIWSVDASLTASKPSMMHDRGELDPKDVYRASILYERSGLFTYFFFGEGGLLSGIGQSTFPMDGAD